MRPPSLAVIEVQVGVKGCLQSGNGMGFLRIFFGAGGRVNIMGPPTWGGFTRLNRRAGKYYGYLSVPAAKNMTKKETLGKT
jgi:hypothetical protein